ncbi:MAG TPA: 50S ribosomal protein L7/L12 [Gemmataceae bacterium]|jgi:large subunit ribosomal protein L7/L12
MAEGNGQTFAPEIEELGKKIMGLTLAKAVELGDYLEKVHGIKPAAGGVVVAAGPAGGGGGGGAEKPPEQTEFTVVLDGLADPAKKINVIKVVREITNLGLKEAKELVEGAPKPVKENVAKDEANAIKKKLEDGGAKASLK